MLRLRLLLAWFLMAAIPMQGFAAASMLFCGMGTEHVLAQVGDVSPALHQHSIQETSHHAHSSHSHADTESHGNTTPGAKQGVPDAGHTCSICAACCNSVAIVGLELVIASVPAPQAELAEPIVLILARATPVPDKPPRA